MIILNNYELFIDKRTSKNNKEYYGLFIKIGDKEHLVSFISSSLYSEVKSLSK